jgi:glycerophosphoryl diester phosphodiesterase
MSCPQSSTFCPLGFWGTIVFTVLIGICLLGATPCQAAENSSTICRRIPLEKFVIQAHRGGGLDRPENTLETFLYAWRIGVVPEADIRLTADGVLVAFHDKNFRRIAPDLPESIRDKSVEQLDFPTLEKIDVGRFRGEQFAGQKIPKIDAVFAQMQCNPERMLYLDIKTVSMQHMAELVRQYGLTHQVIFTSSKHKLLKQWKKLVPESQTLLWVRYAPKEKLLRYFDQLARENFEGITSLQVHLDKIDLTHEPPFEPSPEFLRQISKRLRDRGIVFQVLPWAEADPKLIWLLLDNGVESFATDRPKAVRSAVEDYYRNQK